MKAAALFALVVCLPTGGCGNASSISSAEDAFSSKAVLTPIPEPYRNVWAVDAADCARIDGPTRINIDPATVTFPEGRFDVVAINKASERQLLLSVRYGGGPEQTHILSLSKGWETLSYTSPGIMRSYHRCRA